MTIFLHGLLACILIPAPTELRGDLCKASWAWYPYQAQVSRVEYCEDEFECAYKGVGDGGGYDFSGHTITIDRNYRFPIGGLLATLAHEYGHALGLGHSESPSSIMHSGWSEPWALVPSDTDKENVRIVLDKLEGKK